MLTGKEKKKRKEKQLWEAQRKEGGTTEGTTVPTCPAPRAAWDTRFKLGQP
jgi:hypothetical protein